MLRFQNIINTKFIICFDGIIDGTITLTQYIFVNIIEIIFIIMVKCQRFDTEIEDGTGTGTDFLENLAFSFNSIILLLTVYTIHSYSHILRSLTQMYWLHGTVVTVHSESGISKFLL